MKPKGAATTDALYYERFIEAIFASIDQTLNLVTSSDRKGAAIDRPNDIMEA